MKPLSATFPPIITFPLEICTMWNSAATFPSIMAFPLEMRTILFPDEYMDNFSAAADSFFFVVVPLLIPTWELLLLLPLNIWWGSALKQLFDDFFSNNFLRSCTSMYARVSRCMYSCSSARFINRADMRASSIASISSSLTCCTYSIISSRFGHCTGTSGWPWHLDGSVTIGSIPRENITSNLVGTSLGKSFNFANAGKCPLHKAKSSPQKHKNLWIHQSILSHLQQPKKFVVEKRTNVPSFAT